MRLGTNGQEQPFVESAFEEVKLRNKTKAIAAVEKEFWHS